MSRYIMAIDANKCINCKTGNCLRGISFSYSFDSVSNYSKLRECTRK